LSFAGGAGYCLRMFFMPARRVFLLGLLLAPLLAIAPGCASTKPYTEVEERHFMWIFGRPAKDNPTDQLAHAKSLQDKGKAKAAAKAFRALTAKWPGAPEAPLAQYEYAKWQDEQGKLTSAFDQYQKLVDRYAGQFPYDEVVERQFAIANEVLHKRKGKFLFFGGFKAPERAAPLFESVARNAPRGPHAAEAEYMAGLAYELSEEYELAVVSYLTVQNLYPSSPFAEQAAFGRIRAWYQMAEESPNDAEALDQAWTAASLYVASYPRSANIDQAKAYKEKLYKQRAESAYSKAVYYDKIARKPESALMSYQSFVRLFPSSELVSAAQERITQLSQIVEKKDEK
jgi:outer membrane protein assembly factor BamD (BamD/ComL family)